MRYSKTRSVSSLTSTITLSILYQVAILGCAESRNEIEATLEDYASKLTLFIRLDETREELTVKITLEPERKETTRCPVFDLRATVNQENVLVSESGYEVDASGIERCLFPTFTYPVPEEDLVLTNFFLGDSSPLWREVLGHLDIRVSDSSGDYRAIFDRVVPQEVSMSIIEPGNGELRVGEEVKVEFDPAPEQVDEISIIYRPEGDPSPGIELSGEQKSSPDSARSNVVFTLPTTDAGNGILRIGIIPWNRFSVRCDFKACVHQTLEFFYQNTPLFISNKVTVSR